VQQFADTDVTENQSVNYTLEDMDAAKTRAVEDAYRRARESATAVARAEWPARWGTFLCISGSFETCVWWLSTAAACYGECGGWKLLLLGRPR